MKYGSWPWWTRVIFDFAWWKHVILDFHEEPKEIHTDFRCPYGDCPVCGVLTVKWNWFWRGDKK